MGPEGEPSKSVLLRRCGTRPPVARTKRRLAEPSDHGHTRSIRHRLGVYCLQFLMANAIADRSPGQLPPVGPILCVITLIPLLWIPAASQHAKHYTYKEPFSLTEKGIGSNPIDQQLVLNAEDEEPFVSRVLLQTIQGFHLSVADRPANAVEPLVPKREYKTDIAPLSEDNLRNYNAANNGTLLLDPTLEYGWQYALSYEIHIDRDRYFFIEMKPKLYFKGAASSAWREYKRDYSGDFFAALLSDALKNNFKALAVERHTPR
jgi:hypothetical protein